MEEHSAPLAAMMNGSMREAREGCATLDDIEGETFASFCEYAYVGDYAPAQPQRDLEPAKVEEADSSDLLDGYSRKANLKKKKGKRDSVADTDKDPCAECGRKASLQTLLDEFKSRDYYTVVSPKFRPREHVKGDPFLCQARVYVFADRYDIAELRILALDKLHRALCSSTAARSQMGKVVDLIRFSYSNENTRDNEVGQDRDSLRSMVVHFAVCVFESLVKEDSFLELMEEGGRFARDLTALLGKRVIGNAS